MTTTADAYVRELAGYWRFIRNTLDALIGTLDGLNEEQMNWHAPCEGANSLWILTVHTLGNVEQSILSLLGGAPDTRDREAEFRAHGASVETLRARWHTLQGALERTILGFSPEALAAEYTHPRRGLMTGREVLLLVLSHAAEHLGHAGLTLDLLRARLDALG